MPATMLSYRILSEGLVERLEEGRTFEGRESYVGASEVGGCPRALLHSKLHPRPIRDPRVAGVMLPGRVIENEVVQILRRSLGRALKATGRSQAEGCDGDLKGHPDGLIDDGALAFDPETVVYDLDAREIVDPALRELTGVGVLEIKTASAEVFEDFLRHGLSLPYRDQVTSNMGMFMARWSLIVLVCRENLNRKALFLARFDPAAYERCRSLAGEIISLRVDVRAAWMDAGLLDWFRNAETGELDPDWIQSFMASYSDPDPDISDWASWREAVDRIEDTRLPAPCVERGYCGSCPLRAHRCPAHALPEGEIPTLPEDVSAVVDALLEEREAEAAKKKAAEDAYEAATAGIKREMSRFGWKFAYSDLNLIEAREMNGREGCDFDLLRERFPEAAAACIRPGKGYVQLFIKSRAKLALKAQKGKKGATK